VIACDLPFLETEFIGCLLEAAGDFQAVIPVQNGVNEPLAALYHKDLSPIFEASVFFGNLALHKILATCKVHYLDADPLMEKYPQLFTNFNTLKELNLFL
jgi:molybdopterin-guanine dinucleotide biosynthesis protein A